MTLTITPETVAAQRRFVRDNETVVELINRVRGDLAEFFGTDVGLVDADQYRAAVDEVFADGDRAVNVAGIVVLLRELDVPGDYPGFVVDEILGRELAGTIAGGQPLRLLGEATFHYADLVHHTGDAEAGLDDLEAALAAGFQTRLPGWEWRESESPFGIDPK